MYLAQNLVFVSIVVFFIVYILIAPRSNAHPEKMPGASLWLVPPPTHPLHAILTNLITRTLPALLSPPFPDSTSPPPPAFAPHLTLTSHIPPDLYAGPATSAQAWLDSLPLATTARVRFERVVTEDVFFRRCYLQAGFEGVRDVAGVARAFGVEREASAAGDRTAAWLAGWQSAFSPHVNLV